MTETRIIDAQQSSMTDKASCLLEMVHAMSDNPMEAVTLAACALAGVMADTVRREPGSLDRILEGLPEMIRGSVELTWAARDAQRETKQ